MITWHPTGAGGYSASVTVGGVVIATLHADRDRWHIEHLGGRQPGAANSVGYAKRAALEALAKVLEQATHEVDVALRSG